MSNMTSTSTVFLFTETDIVLVFRYQELWYNQQEPVYGFTWMHMKKIETIIAFNINEQYCRLKHVYKTN